MSEMQVKRQRKEFIGSNISLLVPKAKIKKKKKKWKSEVV